MIGLPSALAFFLVSSILSLYFFSASHRRSLQRRLRARNEELSAANECLKCEVEEHMKIQMRHQLPMQQQFLL
jgi:hypothetical protein